MTTKIPQAQNATLLRYNIGFDQLPKELKLWTLPFPYWQTCKQISNRLAAHLEKENVGVPYRQLNNVLMTQFTLTHGFEWDGTARSRLAMFITDTNEDAQAPTIEAIQYTIEAWLEWWIKLHTDDGSQIQLQLLAYCRKNLIQPNDWQWQAYTLQDLLNLFEKGNSLTYTAIPNLVAHFLHSKESILNGHTVRWRKVQDGESKKLSIVGFTNNWPFYAQYYLSGRTGIKEGEGYFAYKINFSLETQSGRAEPWLFVSFHAQRYGDKSLRRHNLGRRVSFLHAPNTSPLVRKEQLSPLINIRIKNNKEDSFAWDNYPPDLLQKVSTIQLVDPNEIIQNPQRYWFTNDEHDEYYLVHAEGYQYDESGNMLEAGLSQGDLFRVSQAIEHHLSMLVLDQPLTPDTIQTPHGKKRPLLLQSHTNWSNKPNLKQKFERTQEEREAERTTRYLHQREEYQAILENALQRATDGQPVHIAIFWHNAETHEGLGLALKETFLLNTGDDFPDTITVSDHHVNGALLEKLDLDAYEEKKDRYRHAHRDRVQLWRSYLQTQDLPKDKPVFALVELLQDNQKKGLFGVRGVVREACTRENIISQMIFPIRMGRTDDDQPRYLGGPHKSGEHRANSASRDLILRHTGLLYDAPAEVFSQAGIEQPFDFLSFYLHKTNNNILFPIATKLTAMGRHFVRWPGCDEWLPYHLAAPKMGQLFASEWGNSYYKKRKRMLNNRSCLSQNERELTNFVQAMLTTLETPTIVFIATEKWRDWNVWPQLRNKDLAEQKDILSFKPNGHSYQRDDPKVENLLAVIRFKSGVQTPQYITDSQRDFSHEYGLYEMRDELLHYYSLGRPSITSQQQRSPRAREHASKTDSVASGIAYKHPQVVELTPFFVHPDYKSPDGQLQLCRVPHMLRHAPAYAQSNIVLPYPMHLAKQLIQDQLCILAMDD